MGRRLLQLAGEPLAPPAITALPLPTVDPDADDVPWLTPAEAMAWLILPAGADRRGLFQQLRRRLPAACTRMRGNVQRVHITSWRGVVRWLRKDSVDELDWTRSILNFCMSDFGRDAFSPEKTG